ncbi:MAG: hypothetical protein V7750_16760 [Sneathiella sp.]
MSAILNQDFSTNPKRFFRNHFIHQPDTLCFGTATGLRQFDFNVDHGNRAVKQRKFRSLREIPVVSTSLYAAIGGQAQAAPLAFVPVYWLRNAPHDVTSIQLDNGANFFFTTTLNGCYIAVGSNHNPIILHIDGSFSNGRQIQLADNFFGNSPYRGLSYVPNHGYGNADNAIFYGIRNSRTNRWKFYYQGFDAVGPHSNEMNAAGFLGTIDFKRLYVNEKFRH